MSSLQVTHGTDSPLLGQFSLLSDLASKSLWYLMVYSTAEFSHLRSGLFNVQRRFPSSSSYPNGIMKIESVLERVLRLYGENKKHKLDSIYYCFTVFALALNE